MWFSHFQIFLDSFRSVLFFFLCLFVYSFGSFFFTPLFVYSSFFCSFFLFSIYFSWLVRFVLFDSFLRVFVIFLVRSSYSMFLCSFILLVRSFFRVFVIIWYLLNLFFCLICFGASAPSESLPSLALPPFSTLHLSLPPATPPVLTAEGLRFGSLSSPISLAWLLDVRLGSVSVVRVFPRIWGLVCFAARYYMMIDFALLCLV